MADCDVYPFERFDNDAKKVLTLAQAEAERARHSYIGTEHLLLALLQGEHDASRVLRKLGIEEENVRATIANVLGRNQRIVIQQIIPTSRVKKVIELSFEAARREASETVAPIHMLIGLLEEGEGIAAHVLGDLGVTLAAVTAGRSSVPVEPWPRPGERVLVHDPDPPYRLWEGAVTSHEGGTVLVAVPDHPTRPEASLAPGELHSIPIRPSPRCERCQYRAAT